MSIRTTHRSGKAVVLILIAVLAGFLVVGATGAVAILNWNKLVSGLQADANQIATKSPDDQAAGSRASPPSSSPSPRPSAPARRPMVASAPIHANAASYRQWMARDDVLVLVDYYADWCPPCRAISPLLSQLAAKHGDKVVVLKINIDREKQLARQAGVRPIPDVRLMHNGRQLEKAVGGYPYSHYESLVLKHQSKLPAPKAARPTRQPAQNNNGNGGSIVPLKEGWTPPGVKRSR